MKLSNHFNDFVKGALIGSALGSAAGLLFAPKSGQKLREDIKDGYHHITEKGEEYAHALKQKGEQVLHNGTSTDKETLLIGGAVGAVIGATAALLLAPQSGEELREALGEKYEEIRDHAQDFVSDLQAKGKSKLHEAEDKLGDWKDTLSTIVDKLTSAKKKGQSRFEDLSEWAHVGLRLIQQLQGGKA